MITKSYQTILSSKIVPGAFGIGMILIAVLVTLTLYVNNEQAHHQKHVDSAKRITVDLKNAIELELRDKRWISNVFFINNRQLITDLINQPEDENLYHAINAKLGRFFQDYYTFNIISADGTLLVDDFDGMLGESCVEDIQRFQHSHTTSLRLHPHPVRYHFDVPVSVEHNEITYTVLVSFDFGKIASLIRNANVDSHNLMLVHKQMNHLIEATALGARNMLRDRQDYRMTHDEITRILHQAQIDGTSWYAVDMHAAHLFEEYDAILTLKSATILAILLLPISLSHRALRKHYISMEQEHDYLASKNRRFMDINQTLRKDSITDELTGLHNRRYFNDASKLQWDMAQRNQLPLTMVMIDVDFFKLYNDSYGHLAGDECLKQIATAMKDTYTRSVDIVSRYGGEEFIILTSDNTYRESVQRAEKLCETVRQLQIQHSKSDIQPYVTISCGLVQIVPGSDIDMLELLSRADMALYQAKESGRNQVIAYDYSNVAHFEKAQKLTGVDSPASSNAAH